MKVYYGVDTDFYGKISKELAVLTAGGVINRALEKILDRIWRDQENLVGALKERKVIENPGWGFRRKARNVSRVREFIGHYSGRCTNQKVR